MSKPIWIDGFRRLELSREVTGEASLCSSEDVSKSWICTAGVGKMCWILDFGGYSIKNAPPIKVRGNRG